MGPAMYLIALIGVFVLLGVFAVQNPGAQDFNLLGYGWRIPLWVPTAVGVGLTALLLALQAGTSGLGQRFSEVGHSRQIDEHRGVIAGLREENMRLREELAGRRAEAAALRSVRPAAAAERPAPSWQQSLRSLGSRLANR